MSETLSNLLATLNAADNELISLAPEKQTELITALAQKVDSYIYVLDNFESKINSLAETIKLLQDAKKSLENNQESLKNLMKHHMAAQGFDKLSGNIHQVSLVKSEDVVLTLRDEITKYETFDYPELINKKEVWSWDKKAVKEAVKKDPVKYQELGEVTTRLTLRKGVKK